MLRDNGKYLYVITGSHFDFASHVASYALGDDWKDLFDIVIFFARKPSFFWENRPFWRLEGPKEVESLEGWEDLETGDYYSQGLKRGIHILSKPLTFSSLSWIGVGIRSWLARYPPRLTDTVTRTLLPLSGRHPVPFPPPFALPFFRSFVRQPRSRDK